MDFSETSDGDDDDVETFCALSLSLSLSLWCVRRNDEEIATELFLSLFLLLSLSLSARCSFCQQTAATNNIILIYSRGVFWIVCCAEEKEE